MTWKGKATEQDARERGTATGADERSTSTAGAAGARPTAKPMPSAAAVASGTPQSRTLPSGPWTLQPKPKREPTTQEIPVMGGAMDATDGDKLAGLMEQMRLDLSRGHQKEADALLRERLKASKIDIEEARIVALVEELRDVDHARAERERREAEEDEAMQAAEAGRAATAG